MNNSDIYAMPGTQEPKESALDPVRNASLQPSPGIRFSTGRGGSRNYEFAAETRFTGDFPAATMTADQAVFAAIQTTRNRARQLEANHPLTRKFIIMAKTNVVGAKAMRLQSRAGDLVKGKIQPDKMAQGIIERAYLDFSKARFFSIDRRLDRRRFMQMAIARMVVDGECLVRKIRGADNKHLFALQMIDADLLDHRLNCEASSTSGRIIMGVEVDEANGNRPVAYHFRQQQANLFGGILTHSEPGQHLVVPAAEIIHYYEPERPHQTRGITYLAPAGIRAKLLDGMEQAVLVGYRTAASKMGFLSPDENYEGEDLDAKDIPTEVAPGQLDLLPKGIKFYQFDPAYPNADYDGLKKSVTREIAGAFGISYPELGNDYQGVSYSAGQIGVQADSRVWQNFQATLIEMVEENIFIDWLEVQLIFGKLPFPLSRKNKFLAHRFQPPKGRNIDPLKTAKAHELELSIYGADPYEVAAAYGHDLDDTLENFRRAVDAAEDLDLPIPPSWTGGQSDIEPGPDEPDPPPPQS